MEVKGWGSALNPSEGAFGALKSILDRLKIDLNVAETFTVQNYKTHKTLTWIDVHIYSNKAESQPGNTWVEISSWHHKKAKAERRSAGDLENSCILLENSAEGLGSRAEHCWGYVSIPQNTLKKGLHLPQKSWQNFFKWFKEKLDHIRHIVEALVEAIC